MRSDVGGADDAKNAANPKVEEMLKDIAKPATWAAYRKAQKAVDGKMVKIDKLYIDYILS